MALGTNVGGCAALILGRVWQSARAWTNPSIGVHDRELALEHVPLGANNNA